MAALFSENAIIQYHNAEGNIVQIRVLWMDRPNDLMIFMNLNAGNPFPEKMNISAAESIINSGSGQKIEFEPNSKILETFDENLTPGRKKRRDEAWEIIYPLVFRPDGSRNTDIFFANKRGKIVAARAKERHVSKNTINSYLRHFFLGGMVKNALLDNLNNCGAKGKPKNYRAGRYMGNDPENGGGIVLTKTIRRYFMNALEEYLPKGYSLRKILEDVILPQYFKVGVDENGQPNLVDRQFRPTLRQLENFHETERKKDPEKYIKLRKGVRRYNLESRPIEGNGRAGADYPGAMAQVDSTPLPASLVSAFNPEWILSGLHLFTIIDIYSSLLLGFYLSFHDNWESLLFTLLCGFTGVRHFYAKYDFTRNENAFPAKGIISRLVTDRGSAYTGYNSDSINKIGVHITTLPAYRPELKGNVEAELGALISDLQGEPGVIRYRKGRGEKDETLNAHLTKSEFTQKLIYRFGTRNRTFALKKYPVTFGMISDEVERTPVSLWNWGLSLGTPRDGFSEHFIKYNLLPKKTATVREDGIYLGKRRYFSKTAKIEQWLVRARNYGNFDVPVCYFPNNASIIYLPLKNEDLEPAFLHESQKAFVDREWGEIEDYEIRNNAQLSDLTAKHQNERAVLVEQDQNMRTPALKMAREARHGMSKAAQVSNIREKRKDEERRENEQETGYQKQLASTQKMIKPVTELGTYKRIAPDYSELIDEADEKARKSNDRD